jgi:ketosteroid isomerase-like protein
MRGRLDRANQGGRGIRSYKRCDIETLLDWLDAEVEWRLVLPVVLGGQTTMYRGHEGVREMLRDLDEVFAERHIDFSEIHEAGDHLIATGLLRTRGKSSEALIESPFGWVSELKDGKIIQIRTYLDPNEALEPFGLRK